MDRFSEMAAFARVVADGSFSAAARRLGVSTAAVSRQVGSLERRLGARLLNRTTRRVSVTEAGRAFSERCSTLLAEIEEAERSVACLQEVPRGTLRVNAPMSFGIAHVAPVLPSFMARYPDLRVELALTDRFVDVIEEGVDLAIRVAELTDSSLVARRLAPCRRVLCASPAYLERHGTPRAASDLARHNCIGYTVSPDWYFRERGSRVRLRFPGTLVTNAGEVIRAAAIAGVGIGLLPTFVVGPDLRSGLLRPVLPRRIDADTTIYALYPHRQHLSAKVRLFVDFLAERFGRNPYWDRGEPPPPIEPVATAAAP